MAQSAQAPFFAAGNWDKIQAAIEENLITYPAYVFVRDKTQLGYMDIDNTFKFIVGDNKQQVLKVDVLPDVSEGDEEVLYILNGIVYTFDNEGYHPMYQDVTDKIDALQEQIDTLSEKVSALEKAPKLVFAPFPETGESDTLYIDIDEPNIYVWNVSLSSYSPAIEHPIKWIVL